MAIGVIRGHHTISYEALCLLTGLPPWEMDVKIPASHPKLRGTLKREGGMGRGSVTKRWKESHLYCYNSKFSNYSVSRYKHKVLFLSYIVRHLTAISPDVK